MSRLGLIGVTGAVGEEAILLLNERDVHFSELRLFASKRSAGKKYLVNGVEYVVEEYKDPSQLRRLNYVILMTPSETSKNIVEQSKTNNCVFIDNSSYFRTSKYVPLIIPEINIDECQTSKVISNPNCSTIILLMALYPMYHYNTIRRITVSTYQAVSGAGKEAMRELKEQAIHYPLAKKPTVFKSQCLMNVFSHDSPVNMITGDNGEEEKMKHEIRKILKEDGIKIFVSCFRCGTIRSHLENVTIDFEDPVDVDYVRELMKKAKGVTVLDDREGNNFPEPLVTAEKDDVYVGRFRSPDKCVLQFTVSGDQLRKGAALNAIQIYESLIGASPLKIMENYLK